MPLAPDTTSPATGRAKMTRSEAARHAANVRYGKEQPFAARLAAIREMRKQRKAKGAKPKATPEQRQQARDAQHAKNRETVKNAMADGDVGLSPGGFDALMGLGDGKQLDKAQADGMVSMGMAERGGDGVLRLTPAGREAINAANRGDAKGAIDAVSRGTDRAAAGAERDKARGERETAQAQRKQEMAQRDAERAQRQAEREKAQKERAKSGGGSGKEKTQRPTAEDRAAEKEQQRSDNRASVQAGLEKTPGQSLNRDAFDHLMTFADGGEADPDYLDSLAQATGLVERDKSGGYRMTTEGRAYVQAAGRGDTRAAGDALSRAMDKIAPEDTSAPSNPDKDVKKDRLKYRKRRQTWKAMTESAGTTGGYLVGGWARMARGKKRRSINMTDLATKAGARHSAVDTTDINTISHAAHRLGGQCPACAPDEAEMKSMMDDPADYAAHECGDVMAACQALSNLAMLIQSELSEENEEDDDSIPALVVGMRTLLTFIGGEIDELEQAMKDDAAEDAQEGGTVEMKGVSQAQRDEMDESDFAGPHQSFPIRNAKDVANAARLIGHADDPEAVKRKIIAIARRKGLEDAIPEAWAVKKDAEELVFSTLGDAVKAVGGDAVRALAVRFGSADEPDMSAVKDYFTKSTDYWLDAWDRRPMLYHHALDESTRDAPRIGTWTKATVTDEGVWLEGQLDRAHRYYGAIKELIKRGALRVSTDSAPHLVLREARANGTHEVKRWPMVAASLTPTPAEPRLSSVSLKAVLAEIGYADIDSSPEANDTDSSESADGQKAADERMRRLLVELDLLDLEETAL